MAAGCSDIVTFFTPECGFRSSLSKDGEEGVLAIFFRSDPREPINDIVGNQVDFGSHAAGLLGQKARLFQGVIDVVKGLWKVLKGLVKMAVLVVIVGVAAWFWFGGVA